MKHASTLALLAASAVFLAACSSTPVAPPVAQTAPAPMAPAPAQPMAMAPMVKAAVVPAYLDPSNPIATQRSVYFDFDVYTIKPEFAKLVEMHGKYLAANPGVSIRIEGNADERGSAEYNLALGQKRATALTQALKTYGAKDSQMETISFGREKPKATGHNETAWAQNRRADLDYPSK